MADIPSIAGLCKYTAKDALEKAYEYGRYFRNDFDGVPWTPNEIAGKRTMSVDFLVRVTVSYEYYDALKYQFAVEFDQGFKDAGDEIFVRRLLV